MRCMRDIEAPPPSGERVGMKVGVREVREPLVKSVGWGLGGKL